MSVFTVAATLYRAPLLPPPVALPPISGQRPLDVPALLALLHRRLLVPLRPMFCPVPEFDEHFPAVFMGA
jgi:hypothetical protein